MTSIHQANRQTQKLTDKFQLQEWPKLDLEHYGQKIDNYGYKQFCFYAKDDKKIVGVIEGWCECGVMTITEFIVKSDQIGKGIGVKLMERVESFGKKYFIHKITLWTGKTWKANLFYQKLGFKNVGELKNHSFHQDFIIYEKSITE